MKEGFVCLFVDYLTSWQHAGVSQEWIGLENCMCCHTEKEAADQTYYSDLYSDTRPASPSTGDVGSVLGLVGLVSCTLGEIASLVCSFSVWQHVHLSKWTCPRDSLCMLLGQRAAKN